MGLKAKPMHVYGQLIGGMMFVCGLLFMSAEVVAQDGSKAIKTDGGGLQTIDWVMIGAYGALVLVLGVYYGRRQKTTDDYYVGGRKMGSFVIGLSIYATLLSTISYLSVPGEMVSKGPVILYGVLAVPFVYIIVGYFLIPALMRRRLTSAYEVLEEHLGLGARLMAATMFLALRFVWMGLMVNVAARAIVIMFNMDLQTEDPQMRAAAERTVILVVVICSAIAVAYTVAGGLRAVVITDVIQFFLLLGGALLTIVMVTIKMKGFDWFPTQTADHWHRQPVFSFDPYVRVTIFGSILASGLWAICTYGSDQTTIQRFMATGSAKAARKAFLINSIADVVIIVVLGLVGFALLGFFSSQPQFVTGEGGMVKQADNLFPQYIRDLLPRGVAGLVVAAMFAAAMSSLDSGINSTSAVIQIDFIDRLRGRTRIQEHSLWMARILALGIGLVIIFMNILVAQVPGNITDVTNRTVNLLVSPIFGLYFLALFVPFATPFGAILGTICGIAAAILVSFWGMISDGIPLSFQWISATALVVNIGGGIVFSLIQTRGRQGVRAGCVVLAVVAIIAAYYFVAALPFAVISVENNEMISGRTAQVVIIGRKFDANVTVSFENGIGPTPVVTTVQLNEDEPGRMRVTVTHPSGGLAPSVWDVRVTNSEGFAVVFEDALTVVSE